MKYRVVYGDGHVEETNNKQTAIKWANERFGPARVELIETGDNTTIYENKRAREIREHATILKRIVAEVNAGKKIEDLIELK